MMFKIDFLEYIEVQGLNAKFHNIQFRCGFWCLTGIWWIGQLFWSWKVNGHIAWQHTSTPRLKCYCVHELLPSGRDLGQNNGSQNVTLLCSDSKEQIEKSWCLLPHIIELVCLQEWTPFPQNGLQLTGQHWHVVFRWLVYWKFCLCRWLAAWSNLQHIGNTAM